jgi:outer membrane protein
VGKRSLAGSCLALALSVAVASPARADDLASICRDALARNAEYRAAEAKYDSVRQRVPQSLAGLLPSVAATANTFWNNDNINTLGLEQYNSSGWSVTLTQPLFRPQNILALDEARSEVVQARAELSLARQDLLVHTAQAYFDVLFAQDALSSYKHESTADLEQLEQARRSFETGSAPITDVRDAEARYALAVAQEFNASNEVLSRLEVLRKIIDRQPGPLATLKPEAVLSGPEPASLRPWEAAAETDNPEVVAAQAALDATRIEERKSRAERLPTVDLVGSVGYTRSPLNIEVGQLTHANSVGIQVSMPLYEGGGPSAKIRENLDLMEQAHAELDNAQASSILEVQQAYLHATSGITLLSALSRAVDAGETAVAANERGVQVGSRIRIDVLNAEKELTATQRDFARARYSTIMALLKLKAAAGSLSGADIDEVNALLEAPADGAESN